MKKSPLNAWPKNLIREFTEEYLETVTEIYFCSAFLGFYILVSPWGNEEIPASWLEN